MKINLKLGMLALPTMAMIGCATMSLSRNIDQDIERSKTRIQADGVGDGVSLLKLTFLGNETGSGSGYLIYKGMIDNQVIFLKFPATEAFGSVIIAESVGEIEKKAGRNLNVYLSKNGIKEVPIIDLLENDAAAFIQLREIRSFSNGVNRSRLDYNTMGGNIFYIYNREFKTREVIQMLSVETSVKVATNLKSLGYFLTVPVDVATSPIQGVVFMYAYIHAMGGMH
jgi:hypothetical protein